MQRPPTLLFFSRREDASMSTHRLWIGALLLVALAGAAWYRQSVFQAPPSAPPPTIVFITGGSGPYWQQAVNGAKAAADDLTVHLQVETPPDAESLDQQTEMLEGLDPTAIDGVAISPLDAEGQTPLINDLAKQAFVVTFDSDAPGSARQGYVGTSNFGAGRTCARLLPDALPQGGKVAVILANLTKDNLIDRKGGFQEALSQLDDDSKPKYEVVDFLVDDGSDERGTELIRETLAKHDDLACFVGMNARHGPLLMRVLKDENRLGKITLITFDDAPATLDGLAAGHIYATLAQDPFRYGYEAVRMLADLNRADAAYRPVSKTTYSVNVETVRPDGLKEYRARHSNQTPAKETKAGQGS
jgi:ribose transport system substrate-binding protein